MTRVPQQCTLDTSVHESLPAQSDPLADVQQRFERARVAVFLDFDLTLTATNVRVWANDETVKTMSDWIEAQFATPAAKQRKADIERLLARLRTADGVAWFILTNSIEPLVRCMLHLMFGLSELPRGTIIDRHRATRGKGDFIRKLIEKATHGGVYDGPSLIVFADDQPANMVNFHAAMASVADRVTAFSCGDDGSEGGVCSQPLCVGDGHNEVCGLDASQVLAMLDAIESHCRTVSCMGL